ncbi:hypothetical protein P280DRAFT_78082 [Massarina eburnea CBS 473.64]|uniref:Uncharacterized protein n=1 Tax=Massarina eburnea CBS 473.64 TaxID=1395130 RepID=A0A6A6RS72_9PLEO|nr:hypothetical protein P280DRAFT_78082 [Massarina eburnea CBS 473.64]
MSSLDSLWRWAELTWRRRNLSLARRWSKIPVPFQGRGNPGFSGGYAVVFCDEVIAKQ